MKVRLLDQRDARAVLKFHLEALKREPEAFGESAAEMRGKPTKRYKESLASRDGGNFILGVFDGARLAGTAGFRRKAGENRRHQGEVWGLYVAPGDRHKGLDFL